jgi:succinoglycan biosynthesis protein ExoH
MLLIGNAVSNRITMLRPLLIIGVVFLHVAGISDIPSERGPELFSWFAGFFKNGIFRGTVPTMSLISGYLLFSSGLDRLPKRLFSKKFITLAIPFLIFNVYYLIFMVVVNSTVGPAFPRLESLLQSPLRFISVMFGIGEYPLNGPLHFVRDMMVAIILVPAMSVLIRNAPWIGLVVLAIFFGSNMDGVLIFRASSLILFYIGGMAAVYKWDVLALDKFAKPCLAVLIVLCLVQIGFRIDNNALLIMVSPFLIWPSVSLLVGTKIEQWAIRFCKYSFFIFVAHMPIIDSLWWGVLNHASWIPYPIYWFAAPLLTVGLLKVIYDMAMKIAPKPFNLAIGSRAAKPVFVDRRRAARPADAPVYSPEVRLTLTNT